jgi:Fur family transcriptional regulator, ferric uptake regulator
MAGTAQMDRVLDAIRARGGRVSAARRAIVATLLDQDHHHHLTVDDLATAVHARHPDIHVTTVYRTVEALQDLGILYHVHMGHGPAQWHLRDDDHQHLVCQACGRVIEAPPGLYDGIAGQLTATGFVPDPRHFALVGWCAACRDSDDVLS